MNTDESQIRSFLQPDKLRDSVPGVIHMARSEKSQSSQGTASTVALENLAESIARATLRALDERKLAGGGPVNLPIGPGTTVLGIWIPPWEKDCPPGEGPFGLGPWPCHHVIMGIIITHRGEIPLEDGESGKQTRS
jgi:hypothetical protein